MKLEPLIYVSDLRKSVEFYTKTLGFKLGQFLPTLENPTYASIFIEQYKLMLCLARSSNKKFYPKGLSGSGFQLFIQVDNVDETFKKLKEKVEVIDGVETKPWGDREFTLKDPDGYLISFYTGTE